jgi:hypothetical protein
LLVQTCLDLLKLFCPAGPLNPRLQRYEKEPL